jgi:helix-turn-helix protein
MKLRGLPSADDLEARRDELLRGLEVLAGGLPTGSLPDLFAGLERVRWAARLRLQAPSAASEPPPRRELMTADQAAEYLAISRSDVYRRSRTDLRSTAVQMGPGQLRFEPEALDRIIRARRRS